MIKKKDGLGIKVPSPEFRISDVEKYVGEGSSTICVCVCVCGTVYVWHKMVRTLASHSGTDIL